MSEHQVLRSVDNAVTQIVAPTSSNHRTPRSGFRFRVLGYQRVSVHEDQTGSHTFETQSQRIREKLDALYGADQYDLEMLTDNGVSGAYGMAPTGVQRKIRPTLKVISEKLESGRYDCFIVYNLSRLVRSPRWFHQFLEDVIVPSGADFISATQDLNLGNAEGRAMAGILSVMDGLFRDSVVQRNKDAAQTRSSQGYYVGQVGYGWQWEPMSEVPANGRRRILPVSEQGQWIVQIKDWYLSGWNLTRIAGELNQRSVPSPSGQSKWTTSVVNKTMMNPVHAGMVSQGRGGKSWLQGEHYARRYYDPEVLEQLKAARSQRKSWKTNTLKPNEHLLNAIVHCERCGQRLYVSSANTPYRAYRCETGSAQGQRTCPNLTVRADDLEEAVVRHLEQLIANPLMRELLEEEAAQATTLQETYLRCEQQQLQEQLKSVQARSDKWADAFSRNVIAEDEFLRFRGNLETEQRDAAQRFQAVQEQLNNQTRYEEWVKVLRENLLNLPVMWENLDIDERRQVLVNLLEKLTVERRGRDAIVKIKVHLLPEQELLIMFRSLVNMRQKPMGVESLTPRHLAFLYHIGQGKSRRDTAKIMGVNYATISTYSMQVRERLHVSSDTEALALASERIQALLPNLPIGEIERPPQNKVCAKLTPALLEILPYLVKGATNVEIAKRTGLSVTTIGGRRARIMQILNARSAFDLAEKALTLKLLTQK